MRGMQRLTVNHRFGKIQFVGPRSQCCGETSLASVQVVSQQGVAPVGKVHSNLMGSAGLQFHFHQGMLLVLFEGAIDRDCWFAQFVVSNRLQQPLTGVRAQWGVDQFCGGLWASVDDREVPLAHGPFFKLFH